jgi:hypothetical protein
VKENEMVRAGSTNCNEEDCILNFGGKARMKETARNIYKYVGGWY